MTPAPLSCARVAQEPPASLFVLVCLRLLFRQLFLQRLGVPAGTEAAVLVACAQMRWSARVPCTGRAAQLPGTQSKAAPPLLRAAPHLSFRCAGVSPSSLSLPTPAFSRRFWARARSISRWFPRVCVARGRGRQQGAVCVAPRGRYSLAASVPSSSTQRAAAASSPSLPLRASSPKLQPGWLPAPSAPPGRGGSRRRLSGSHGATWGRAGSPQS